MRHIHFASYRYPIMAADGLEWGTCDCRVRVIRQVREGGRGVFIPRDVDVAHGEALAECPVE
jgi:hypothetical protein